MVGVAELESATPCVSCKCSNQLSYTPVSVKAPLEHLQVGFGKLFFDFFIFSCKFLSSGLYYSERQFYKGSNTQWIPTGQFFIAI